MSYQKYAEYNRKFSSKMSITDIKSSAQSCILTSFIYALSEFEKEFGIFWGHGTNGQKSSEQEIYYDRYSILRKKILDNGNYQIRKFNTLIEKNLKENINGF